jgi:hypothetical protein
MISPKETILEYSKRRYELLDKRNLSFNEETFQYEFDPPEIDELGDTILALINEYKDDLPFEFIIEELTKLGQAPCLLYDDDGRFAVSADGFQDLSTEGGSDINMICFVEKEQWKPTVREALNYYLSND